MGPIVSEIAQVFHALPLHAHGLDTYSLLLRFFIAHLVVAAEKGLSNLNSHSPLECD